MISSTLSANLVVWLGATDLEEVVVWLLSVLCPNSCAEQPLTNLIYLRVRVHRACLL